MVSYLDSVEQLHALLCAVSAKLLTAIAVADDSEEWQADGAKAMAHWLTYRFGISEQHARELVRVARALDDRPALAQAHFTGSLSYDKVRAVATLSIDENEAAPTEHAISATIHQLQDAARRSHATTEQELTDATTLSLKLRRLRDGSIRGNFTFPPVEGHELEKTVDLEAQRRRHGVPATDRPPLNVRRAQALLHLTRGHTAGRTSVPKPTVVTHVHDQTLATRRGWGYLQGGADIPIETIRRLACFGRVQIVTRNSAGDPLGIGRASRVVPPWLEELVWERDRGCIVPGCHDTKYAECHHVWHWVDGGPTDLDNLVLLCWYHHTLVHEKGWSLGRAENGTWLFIRPDGSPLEPRAPVLRDDIARRFFGPANAPELIDTS